ncbi:MAG TPA: membrane protein insertion efficiency factor YidD [Candidatus Binataceae bacterium]|nr:membrane protein insertion efficiency factor YidD [Candidatus Binataceae bacterium]
MKTASTNVSTIPIRTALGALRIYRAVISPIFLGLYGPACRFEPTCSVYAADAITAFGVMRGTALAARRLARCHPLGGHGHDPVPAASSMPERSAEGCE